MTVYFADGEAGRHGARHEPRPRRTSHARPPAQLLRQAVQHRPLRRPQGRRADRLRGTGAARAPAQAADDHGRRERLSARDRLPAHRRRVEGGRRVDGRRHGAHRGPRRRRRASEPGAARRLRHVDDAQDAARPARRPGPLPRAVREGCRQGAVPRRAGRTADAHHRGQGRVLQGSDGAVVRATISDRSWPTRRRWPARSRATGSGW